MHSHAMTTLALLALSLVLLSACGGADTPDAPAEPESKTIEGVFVLRQQSYGIEADRSVEHGECWGKEGYSDIQEGARVVVRNGSGQTIGTVALSSGTRTGGVYDDFLESWNGGDCEFSFSVDVPPDEDFYSIEVSHRGELTYSRSELTERGWGVELELGG